MNHIHVIKEIVRCVELSWNADPHTICAWNHNLASIRLCRLSFELKPNDAFLSPILRTVEFSVVCSNVLPLLECHLIFVSWFCRLYLCFSLESDITELSSLNEKFRHALQVKSRQQSNCSERLTKRIDKTEAKKNKPERNAFEYLSISNVKLM